MHAARRRRTRFGRTVIAVLTLLLLTSGCVTIDFNHGGSGSRSRPAAKNPFAVCDVRDETRPPSDTSVVVHGCIADPHGHPVKATVALASKRGAGEDLVGWMESLFVPGGPLCIACLPGSRGGLALTAETDATGQFVVRIPAGTDAAKVGSNWVAVEIPSTGVVIGDGFQIREGQDRDIFLKPFLAWDPQLRLDVHGGTITPHFQTIDGVDEYDLDTTVGSLRVRDGHPFDAHLLPPSERTVRLTVTGFSAEYSSPEVRVPAGAVPVSKGARCRLISPTGKAVAIDVMTLDKACPFTDGDWSSALTMQSCPDGLQNGCFREGWKLEVDLGRVVDVRDIVVSGSRTVTVTTSPDGQAWTKVPVGGPPLSETLSSFGARTSRARFVRVAADDLKFFGEVSVFA